MARGKKGGEKVRMTTPTIVMEDELWTELRMQALREKTSASKILRRLAREYLKKSKKGGKEQ